MTGNEVVRFVAALVVIGASAYLLFRTNGWIPLICAVSIIAGLILLIDLIQSIRRRRRTKRPIPLLTPRAEPRVNRSEAICGNRS